MNKALITIIIVIILVAIGFGGWYFFLKKSAAGGACAIASKCETGLTCVNKICSDGKLGSGCVTYKDCEEGLICTKSICSEKPDYSKYFDKVTISKMKPALPPGPNNPPTVTDTFTKTDAIEVDITGVKTTTIGPYYYEFVNSTTGEVAGNTQGMETKLEGRDTGSGTDLANLAAGQYDVNIYYNNELVYTTSITMQ